MNKKSLAIGIFLGVLISGLWVFALEEGQILNPDQYQITDFSLEYLDCRQDYTTLDLLVTPIDIVTGYSCLTLQLQDDGNYLVVRQAYTFHIDLFGANDLDAGGLPTLEQCLPEHNFSSQECFDKVYSPYIISYIDGKRAEITLDLEDSKGVKIPIDLDVKQWVITPDKLNGGIEPPK